jgi:fructan beta-fructosidase
MIPTLLSLALALSLVSDLPDLLIADFEGDDYAGWITTGDAFGKGPAHGTLPGQMHVGGFLGRGLVNSFLGGDDATGTLTSSTFAISRPYINFLIGGGRYPGETCVNLLIDGKVVLTATGPNDQPGGVETLDWLSWHVAEFQGKQAVIQVIDRRKGGWGHINVDQIVQSERPQGLVPMGREIVVNARYLHLPVQRNTPPRRVKLVIGGRTVREFDIKLAEGRPDFQVFADLAPFAGEHLKIEASLPAHSRGMDAIAQAAEIPDRADLYREKLRPQFHFTSRRGWLNDPNGLVWLDGEYHLFYQHNPYGWEWGNMHWGHAVSPDLFHWTELPDALTPRTYGDFCFSGSAVVDQSNTSGFGQGGLPPLVAAYTSTGRGECIIFSNDRGRTWTEFTGNPVIKHPGRDPRLLWHEPTRRWIMAVYDEANGHRVIAFHSSPDLKTWTYESQIDGFFECPDLFEIRNAAEPGKSAWVLYAADGEYVLGEFDGHRFVPRTKKQRLWYGDFYAAQTFSNAPDGRRIQIGWARIDFPGMPFNQQMTLPCELTLHHSPEGDRLFAMPVAEPKSLRFGLIHPDLKTVDGKPTVIRGIGELLKIDAEFQVGPTGSFSLAVRGVPITYDAAKATLSCGGVTAPLVPTEGKIKIQALLDRGSVEVFGNDGRVAISRGARPTGNELSVTVKDAKVLKCDVHELASSWR